jgi:chromosome segregation ATPase
MSDLDMPQEKKLSKI